MTKKEKEALRRLNILKARGLMPEVVRNYKTDKQVYFSEFNGFCGALFYIENAPDIVLNKIKELERNGDVVYHATHEKLWFGECWDLFVVTDEDVANDEWGESMRDDFDKYGIQFAYVINIDKPTFSEFGSIYVDTMGGGIVRWEEVS